MERKTPSRFGFGVIETAFWCAYGSFMTFYVPYITIVHGISAGTAGALMSVFTICACFGQMLLSSLCDKYRNNKQVLIAAMVLVLALYYALYFTDSNAVRFLVIAVLGLIQVPASSALDTWILKSYPEHPEYYGPLRAMGSVGYAVLVLGLGFLINAVGYGVMLIFGTFFVTTTVVAAVFMPGVPETVDSPAREAPKTSLRAMPSIVWFMIAMLLLVSMGNSPVIQLQSLLVRSVGGNITLIGLATSVNAFFEFPAMCLSQYIMHVKASLRMFWASLGYFVTTAAMIFARTPLLLILMLALNGMCMGVLMIARRQLVCENVPHSLQNRAHALGDAAYISFGGFFGNLMGGYVIQYVGTRLMLIICTAVHALAVAASGVLIGKHNTLVGDKRRIAYAPPEEPRCLEGAER